MEKLLAQIRSSNYCELNGLDYMDVFRQCFLMWQLNVALCVQLQLDFFGYQLCQWMIWRMWLNVLNAHHDIYDGDKQLACSGDQLPGKPFNIISEIYAEKLLICSKILSSIKSQCSQTHYLKKCYNRQQFWWQQQLIVKNIKLLAFFISTCNIMVQLTCWQRNKARTAN